MAIERAVGAFLRREEERQGRRDQPLRRGGDEVCQARLPHRPVQGGEVVLTKGGRNIHRRGSWIGLDHAPKLVHKEHPVFVEKTGPVSAMTPDAPAARITQRICEAIKDQIASGRLGPGARLPSTRALAAEWGVSRTTVTAAYEQLIAEGYLETRQRARARVAQGLGRQAA